MRRISLRLENSACRYEQLRGIPHFGEPNDALHCTLRELRTRPAELGVQADKESGQGGVQDLKPLHLNTPAPQLHTLTVLVVEDDDGVRRIIARELEQAGFRVLTAGNGVEALSVLKQSSMEVHLVVSDLLMPQLDGHQLAARLAALPNPPEIIFVSAFRSDLELDRPIVTKPFHLDDLSAAVQRILEKQSRPLSGDRA